MEIDDLDMRWPFTKAEMVGLRVMYTGATISHSNESMLRAFLSLPVTNCELLESGDIGYALKWSDWCMTMNVDDVGLHFELFHSGQQPSSDFAVVTCAPNCQIEFNWPDREKGKLRLTWPKIEKCFGISKVMFKARKVANEDPLMALRDCHEKVRESDKLWASARPGFSVKDFLNSAASKAGNFPATAHTMR